MKSILKEKALELGFIGVGFSMPEKPCFFESFKTWLSNHRNADMSWMERNVELRAEPSLLLEGCNAIISLAYPYPSRKPCTTDGLTVSRYSQPSEEDYHYRLKNLCRELVEVIKTKHPKTRSRICVDSAPILERSLAYSSGIGFLGKNNMLIIPGYGSYLYLAEILTSAPLEVPEIDPIESRCRSCALCIDSCPTGALTKPYDIDASKCLSFLTIESKGDVNPELGSKMGDCFFGCDRCQEVCPFNDSDQSRNISLPATEDFMKMSENSFNEIYGKTSFERAGLKKIKANIIAVKSSKQ